MCNIVKDNNYVNFLVKNCENRMIEVSCNPLDKDIENDLIYISFYNTVLERYRNAGDGYVINENTISYLHEWLLPFHSVTGTVRVLLTDIGMLPYEEQCHWKSFAKYPL